MLPAGHRQEGNSRLGNCVPHPWPRALFWVRCLGKAP
jgi:hypothetical protein